MHIRLSVIIGLICSLVVLSGSTAKSHLEGRVTYTPGNVPTQYLESEKQLQGAYDELFSLLEPEGKKKLGIAQSSWQRFKSAQCDFNVTSSAASPMHPMSYTECLMVMNVDRTAELQNELQWHQLLDPSFSTKEE